MTPTFAIAGALVLFAATALAQTTAAPGSDWSYTFAASPPSTSTAAVLQPQHWQDGYPDCNRNVQQQAPINIAATATDFSLRPLELSWYHTSNFSLALTPMRSLVLTPNDVRPALWDGNTDTAYGLQRVEFHTPSQHTFGGAHRDLELLFVHQDRRGAGEMIVSLTATASATSPEHAGLRAALFRILVQQEMPRAADENRQTVYFAAMAPLLRDYTTYTGTHTTPPCGGGVTYYVYHEPLRVSVAQLATLRRFLGVNETLSGAAAADGNRRPTHAVAAGTAVRRFYDFIGWETVAARPTAAQLNQDVDVMALAAVIMACFAAVIALLAARLAAA
jgi:carbonic anhydrase